MVTGSQLCPSGVSQNLQQIFMIARSADKLLAVRSVAINKFSNPLALPEEASVLQ